MMNTEAVRLQEILMRVIASRTARTVAGEARAAGMSVGAYAKAHPASVTLVIAETANTVECTVETALRGIALPSMSAPARDDLICCIAGNLDTGPAVRLDAVLAVMNADNASEAGEPVEQAASDVQSDDTGRQDA